MSHGCVVMTDVTQVSHSGICTLLESTVVLRENVSMPHILRVPACSVR